MPHAVFAHEGSNIDFTPTVAVVAGEVVVQGDLVGVACRPLAANEPGALAVFGVFDFLKAINVAYTVGTILYWDDTNNIVTTTATGNKLIGKVTTAAATTDTTVRIRMSQ